MNEMELLCRLNKRLNFMKFHKNNLDRGQFDGPDRVTD